MKSYEIVAWASPDGCVICTACADERGHSHDEDFTPVFADSEWDSYPVCGICEKVIEYVTVIEKGEARKCGECNFFIWNRSATNTPGCSRDWEKTTHYEDTPCEKYEWCQMGAVARDRLRRE